MKRKIKNYILLLVLFIYVIFYKFFIFVNIPAYSETITACFLIILLSSLFLVYGYRKDKRTKLKNDILKNTFFFVIITFTFMYLLGFFTGFLTNAYSLKINKVFENILSPIIIIVTTELIRYIFISSNTDKKKDIILFTITGSKSTIIVSLLSFFKINKESISSSLVISSVIDLLITVVTTLFISSFA